MLKIIFFGTPQFAVPTLKCFLQQPEIEVLGVVTQPDKPRGRGKQLIPSAVKKVALDFDLPVWQPRRIKKDAETLAKLKTSEADAFVVVAYGQILSPEILNIPPLGCINGHGSILPQYRGAAPIQWCLYNGEAETGMTAMLMDAGMDTGDMLLKQHTPIRLLDNARDLAENLADIAANLLISTLLKLDQGDIKPIPQDNSQATYAPLIKKSDYELDWLRSGIALHNQIRGFFPNCATSFRGKKLKIKASAPLGKRYWQQLPPKIAALSQQEEELLSLKGSPGEVVYLAKKLGPIIQTGEGLLLLRELQPAGKKAQSGADFINGMRLSLGETFFIEH
ncbi:MAG: methionyl-tRNA formyltransferase [Spirulinaceae cyanobacterium]